jgi:zinc/manganese transport system substrate-binding protein
MRATSVHALVMAALAALLAAGCGLGAGGSQASGGRLEVVAAESFWGSIAAQVGGDKVHVTSIVNNPDADPHDYDATPQDARAIARTRYFVFNGAGYDEWARKLAAANPTSGRLLLDVGALAGVREGGNPHLWYSAPVVYSVVDRIAADLGKLDPASKAYFDEQRSRYKNVGLKDYSDAIAAIKGRYAGTPVGASESIFAYMAESTGLRLITPAGYMQAVAEGADPSAADKATVDEQITGKQVKVFVFNSQNSTPDVQGVVSKARAAGIPVVQITETPVPASASFQDWQTAELKSLLAALGG